jgi:hypothetical protein
LFFETKPHNVAQTGLKLAFLLPQPPKCCDYRCVPLCPHHVAYFIGQNLGKLDRLGEGKMMEEIGIPKSFKRGCF